MNTKTCQRKLSRMESDIFRCLEEGMDDIRSIMFDIANIYQKCEVPSILPDFFQALQSLLSDDFISLDWSEYQYSEDEIEVLNHMEMDQLTGYWKWHVAVVKNSQFSFVTLQGISDDGFSVKEIKKSLHSFGINALEIQIGASKWDSLCRVGLALPTITMKEKGLDIVCQK